MKNTRDYILKLMILVSGNVCAAFGVFLCIAAQKGADPITVLLDGLMNTFGVSIGIAVMIFNGMLMIICYLFDRTSIKVGTVFAILSFSMSLDFFLAKWITFVVLPHYSMSWMLLVLGIICMGVGFSLGIFANIGCTTADIALDILISKTNLNMKPCKWILDACYTLMGILLGGKFGIGTVACVLLVGMVYSYTLSMLEKVKLMKCYERNVDYV